MAVVIENGLFATFGYIHNILLIREIEGKFQKSFRQNNIKTNITNNLCDLEINLSEAGNRSDNENSNTEIAKLLRHK